MSDEVNNNVQEVNETVDVSPNAHENAEALSFDDLDAITDGRSPSDLVKELGKSDAKSKSQEPSEKNQLSNQRTSEEQTDQEIQQEIKKILARRGEENMELDADTMFTHKVDGQDVDVNLQELLNNYSGRVSYEQKFQELADNRRQFEEEYEDHQEFVNLLDSYSDQIDEHIENNNYLSALSVFAEATGVEPFEFKRELLAQLAPEIERRSLLSPEEIRAEELEAQNEFLSRQQELSQQQMYQDQEIQVIANEIRDVQDQYGIDDEDFREAYEVLKSQEELEGVEITAPMVGEFYNELMAYEAANDVLQNVNPALASNDEVLDNLQQIIVDNPDFSEQDIVDIVYEVYGGIQQKASRSVSQKVSNSVPSNIEKPSGREYEDYVDWEDI